MKFVKFVATTPSQEVLRLFTYNLRLTLILLRRQLENNEVWHKYDYD